MMTTKLAITCFKFVVGSQSYRVKLVADLQSKIAANQNCYLEFGLPGKHNEYVDEKPPD
ncbi:hypothetical protein AVEN_52981-1, partial [Araneus ventricosus]